MFNSGMAAARLLIVWGGLLAAPAKPGSDEAELAKVVLPKPYLVLLKGIVVETTETKDPDKRFADWRATVQVAHVFCGPQALRGTTFVVTGCEGRVWDAQEVHPILRAGEESLWLIAHDPKHGFVRRMGAGILKIIPLDEPCRKTAQTFADSLEDEQIARELREAIEKAPRGN